MSDKSEIVVLLNTYSQEYGKMMLISLVKESFGHMLGDAGANSTGMTIKSKIENLLSPTRYYEQVDSNCLFSKATNTAKQKVAHRVLGLAGKTPV